MAELPGWQSLDSVSKIHHWLEMTEVGILVLLAVAEAFAIVYSNRKDVLVAQAERQAATRAADRIAQLEQQQMPRRLSHEQRQTLSQVLAPFSGQAIQIYVIVGDGEGKRYAQDFVEVVRGVGWNDGGGTGVNEGGGWRNDPLGIEIHINDAEGSPDRVPRAAVALMEALTNLGLLNEANKLWRNPQVPAGTVRLIIGHKPQNPG